MAASPEFPKLPKGWSEEKILGIKSNCRIRVWKKSGEAKRALFVVHGQGEQSHRYLHFPHYLESCYDIVAAIDLPGHGETSGVRGHIENFSQYVDALVNGIEDFKSTFPGPIDLFGHSLGGLVVLSALKDRPPLPIKKVVVSAPLLELAMPVPKLKKFFGELLEPLLGRIPMKNEINPAVISHDLVVQKTYAEDPLNHSQVTPRFFVQMTKQMQLVRAWKGPIDKPITLILPMGDELVSWQTSFFWYNNLLAEKKRLELFPGFRHESFNEIGKERAFVAFLNAVQS